MKKYIAIFLCTTCISAGVIAQPSVKIGNLEFIVKKAERDTVAQITVNEPCPPCPAENKTQKKTKFIPYNKTQFFGGAGAIFPDYSADYYTVLGGKSFNVDAGWIHTSMITRWFALGGTLQYSFYNYKLRDAASNPAFAEEVTGRDYDRDDIRKQAYRSHNAAASAFTRLYLRPGHQRGSAKGMYIDLGVQGDFIPYKYCMINTWSEGKKKYHEDYAFNSFTASAIARVGFGSSWAVFARYRLADAYNREALQRDLPPMTIGVQFF